jgi:hypothetical protein
MRDSTQYTPAELLRLYRADVVAALTILHRYKSILTPLELAVIASLARDHSIEQQAEQHPVDPVAEPHRDRPEWIVEQPDPMAGLSAATREWLERELAG